MTKNFLTWDLTDLYINEELLKNDLKNFDVTKFLEKKHFDSAKNLYESITEYEKITEKLARMHAYVGLAHYADLTDEKTTHLYQMVNEGLSPHEANLHNFILDLTDLSEEILNRFYDEYTELKRYKPFIEQVQLFKKHKLSKETEMYASLKDTVCEDAWVQLYDETLAGIDFEFDGQKQNIEIVLDKMGSADGVVRKRAAESLSKGLESQSKLFLHITNTLAKNKSIEDDFRKYSSPMESRHLSNMIEPEVAETLVSSVKESYRKLSHRYYRLKAQVLGKTKLEYWDRNAPVFNDEEVVIPYEKAKSLVFDAYYAFSPQMASIVQQYYDNAWIDVEPRPGKASGAFSYSTVPDAHPYILLNYQGKVRDVMTLAHELGHGVHQILATKQGYLLSDTPLTIAETASVFGEMLTYAHLKKQYNHKRLLAGKIDDMLNTVVRQIAFYEFEKRVHLERRHGVISSQRINGMWRETQIEALGEFVNLDHITDNFWSYISHFIHTPFYVYAYAFGDCLVNTLYMHYKSLEGDARQQFVNLYIGFLESGGSKTYKELLAPFNLDPTNKNFWFKGLSLIETMINEFDSLI